MIAEETLNNNSVDLAQSVEQPKEILKDQKAIRKRFSFEQKECLLNFIMENPELLTHSSTKENEIELWNDLHKKLTDLKPERTLDNWKSVLSRWRYKVLTKPEAGLMAVDYKFKLFLNKIIPTDQLSNSQGNTKLNNVPKQTITEIVEKVHEIESEKSNLMLEVDDYELKLNKYKYIIHALENEIKLKRSKIIKLNNNKISLNKKRKILEEKNEFTEIKFKVKIENENQNQNQNQNEILQEQTEV